MNENISQQELMEKLLYDKESGIFTWRVDSGRAQSKAGSLAGYPSKGYWRICINQVEYAAHRLAWLYITGRYPLYDIDHINCVKSDNRFCNLREATRRENMQNIKRPRKDSKSGVMGVYAQGKKFVAYIHHNQKKLYLGIYPTKDEAQRRHIEVKRKLHPFSTI